LIDETDRRKKDSGLMACVFLVLEGHTSKGSSHQPLCLVITRETGERHSERQVERDSERHA